MIYLCLLAILICIYILCDVNYVLRTCFTIFSGRLYENKCSLGDITTIYGVCSLQDCDVGFNYMRTARIVREIDFARYHFYDRTGIYDRSRHLGIKSLQGCTLITFAEPVPLFTPYKIDTKLVYSDSRSLFFEHEVITLFDRKLRCLLVSRQYAMGTGKDAVIHLLQDIPGSNLAFDCPEYIKSWLQSMHVSSKKLRNAVH